MKLKCSCVLSLPVCPRCNHLIYEDRQRIIHIGGFHMHEFCAHRGIENTILLAVMLFGAVFGIGCVIGW